MTHRPSSRFQSSRVTRWLIPAILVVLGLALVATLLISLAITAH